MRQKTSNHAARPTSSVPPNHGVLATGDGSDGTAIVQSYQRHRRGPEAPVLVLGNDSSAASENEAADRGDHKVDLVGPILASTSWQTKDAGGFSQADFTIDWDNRRVTCPSGETTSSWREDRSQNGAAVVRARFPMSACRPCEDRERCTRTDAKSDMGRRLTLRPRAEQEVTGQARAQEDTREWKEQYAHRAGVEGTISQGVRAFGLRRCRYSGLAKARLQHQLSVTAMNFHRLNAWWSDIPRARTRTSHLTALRPAE